MPYRGYFLEQRIEKVTLMLWMNLGFHLFSPKTRRPEIFGCRKFQPRSISTLPLQLSKKQRDPRCCTHCLICSDIHVILTTLRQAESALLWWMQKTHLKFQFLKEKFLGKLLWRIKKRSTKDWMQLTLQIISPNQYWHATHGILGQTNVKK